MTTQAIYLKALKQFGAEWQKGSMHRVYFNDLAGWMGLEVELYNSGNIAHAWDNGAEISNAAARRWMARLADAKVWYDLASDKFAGKNIDNSDLRVIIANIKAAVEGRIDEEAISR